MREDNEHQHYAGFSVKLLSKNSAVIYAKYVRKHSSCQSF